jgi:hypothetical protein
VAPPGIASTKDDLLAAEPANLTGALIGYARVSTSGQILDRQTCALTEAGCIRVFADKLSGKTADRPEFAACLDYLRAGDTLVVPRLDRRWPPSRSARPATCSPCPGPAEPTTTSPKVMIRCGRRQSRCLAEVIASPSASDNSLRNEATFEDAP